MNKRVKMGIGVVVCLVGWMAAVACVAEATAEDVVGAWRRGAAGQAVSAESVEAMAGMLRDLLEYEGVRPGEGGLGRYEASVRAFLGENRWALEDDEPGRGMRHWLAYCTAEAFSRRPMEKAEAEAVRRGYEGLVEEAAKLILGIPLTPVTTTDSVVTGARGLPT